MSDYLTAYLERLERNQTDLIKLINDVQAIDNTIEAYVYDYPNRTKIYSKNYKRF